jgi:hypothetical protein
MRYGGCARGDTQGSFLNVVFFEKVGYIDETLHYAMDFDLFFRISKKLKLYLILSNTCCTKNSTRGNYLFLDLRVRHLKIAEKMELLFFLVGAFRYLPSL